MLKDNIYLVILDNSKNAFVKENDGKFEIVEISNENLNLGKIIYILDNKNFISWERGKENFNIFEY